MGAGSGVGILGPSLLSAGRGARPVITLSAHVLVGKDLSKISGALAIFVNQGKEEPEGARRSMQLRPLVLCPQSGGGWWGGKGDSVSEPYSLSSPPGLFPAGRWATPSVHQQTSENPCEHRPKGPLSCSVGSGCTGSSPQALSPSPHPHPTLPSLSPSWLVGRTWAPCHPGSSLLFLIKCNDHDEVLARSPGMLQCWGGGILWGSGKPWEPRDRL